MYIKAYLRNKTGTKKNRNLRLNGNTPAIIYGIDKPINIFLNYKTSNLFLNKKILLFSILKIEINNFIKKVLFKNIQIHAYKKQILHIDFQKINNYKKINVEVPIKFINSNISPAIKLSSGIINYICTKINIICFPKNLPKFIIINLSKLKINDSIHLFDLKLSKKIKIISKKNITIVSASSPKVKDSDENKDK